MKNANEIPIFDTGIAPRSSQRCARQTLPAKLVRNPVMFVTGAVALLVTLIFFRDFAYGRGDLFFTGQIAAWLWFTVLFANFAEAIAEGRGKAHADALRATRSETLAKLLLHPDNLEKSCGSTNPRTCSKPARSFSSRPAIPFLPTARWSRKSPQSTNRP